MALRAMHSAATGMRINEFNLDTVANNLANAGTTAFKRTAVNFEDVFYEHQKVPGAQDANGALTPLGVSVGLGARIASTAVDHRQGGLLRTGQPLDVAIEGEGFFPITDPAGQTVYTRTGTFTRNADGQVVLSSANRGRLLEPAITIPPTATTISITSDGTVSYIEPPATQAVAAGQIQLAKFSNPQGLVQVGENLFVESAASGAATLLTPGQTGAGTLVQATLETSNVEPVKELIELIKTQRHFEMNSQIVQAADQMLQLVANLRRI